MNQGCKAQKQKLTRNRKRVQRKRWLHCTRICYAKENAFRRRLDSYNKFTNPQLIRNFWIFAHIMHNIHAQIKWIKTDGVYIVNIIYTISFGIASVSPHSMKFKAIHAVLMLKLYKLHTKPKAKWVAFLSFSRPHHVAIVVCGLWIRM